MNLREQMPKPFLSKTFLDERGKSFLVISEVNVPVSVVIKFESNIKKQAKRIRNLLDILKRFSDSKNSISFVKNPIYKESNSTIPPKYSFENEVEFSYFQGVNPIDLQEIDGESLIDPFCNLLKYLVDLESDMFENLELAIECLEIVVFNKEILIKFCPLNEKYLLNFDLSLNYLKEIKYYMPFINKNPNFNSYNPSKLLCYGLAIKILEILNKGSIPETHDMVQSKVNKIQNINLYFLVSKMIEEGNNITLKEIYELFEIISTKKESICSQCKKDFSAHQTFCKKNLCEKCLNSKEYCKDCNHYFEVLNESDSISTPSRVCRCGKNALISGLHIICDCSTYCLICKNQEHTGNCIASQTFITKICCHKKHQCIRTPDSLFYYCYQCSQNYCICCDRIDSNYSHVECSKSLSIEKALSSGLGNK